MIAKHNEITFSDSDIANIDDWIAEGEFNPHNVRPFLLHDHGFTVAVVFASHLGDALDIAVDENKMERYLIAESDMGDYGDDGEGIAYLGNAGEAHDIESLGVIDLPNCKRSFCAQFSAR